MSLISVIFFISCEDAYKRLQDNIGQYNTCMSYSNKLLESLREIRIYLDAAKASAKTLIDYVDTYLTYYSKGIPSSIEEVNNIDDAMFYYMSISKQMSTITSGFADKADIWTQEEAEELFYSKLAPFVDAEIRAIRRWKTLQEEYAKKHEIRLIDFNKIEKLR